MMSEYPEPGAKQDKDQLNKENEVSKEATTNKDTTPQAKNLRKRKHFKVLHEDGSFADLPYNNEPGGGASEGVVGIGT